MSSETPSQAEIAAMLNGLQQEPRQPEEERKPPTALEIACGGRLLLVQTPADLILKDSNGNAGETFHVTDLQAWGYTPFGILGVGSFDKNAGEDDWESQLFAADVIHSIRFNKARYEEIIEEIKVENEQAEPEDSGVDSGVDGGTSSEAVAA